MDTTYSRKVLWQAFGIGVSAIAVSVGYAMYSKGGPRARVTPIHKVTTTSTATPTKEQRDAAALDYPPPSGSWPSSISIEYDAAHDRSTMTLTLLGVPATVPMLYHVGVTNVKLVSEYTGKVRQARTGELSVRCEVSIVTTPAGVLAPSSPIATIRADGATIEGKPLATKAGSYRAVPGSGGVHETLAFRITTAGLVQIAKASSVSAQVAGVGIKLGSNQLADLREFTSRMRPGQ